MSSKVKQVASLQLSFKVGQHFAVQSETFTFCLWQTKSRLKRKLEWPDGQDSIRRSTDCERGRGSDYGHLRIRGKSDTEAQKNDDCGEPAKSASHAAAPEVPDPGPLACLSVAIVGFQRDHEVQWLQPACSECRRDHSVYQNR